MNVRFHQVVDTIHGTIYYTKLEQEIINTPFFNRLHDVNQSSTVYLTFPPNRTKRYEHSLGTMQLTSEVFCNAIRNSLGSKALDSIMESADKAFLEIIRYISDGGGGGKFIFHFQQKTLRTMDFMKSKKEEAIIDMIDREFWENFHNNCLLNQVSGGVNKNYHTFLLLCLLQAMRIVGLLHDIGHPPQSHIIENVLKEIDFELRKIPGKERNERQKKFLSILSSYKDVNDKSILQIDGELALKTQKPQEEHLHEMIGIQIIKQIVDYVFPDLMEKSIKNVRSENSIVGLLYLYTVIEFIFAIMRNKNAFWTGLHGIVDGTIDTDRMDFVPRDSQNSGMLWGRISYKRLINTVRFGIVSESKLEASPCVCFSDKNIQQMDDLLNDRYKIFTMINYHHRSTKIASLYQKAVKVLAKQYLNSQDPDTEDGVYFSDISGLWRTIEIAYSNEASVLNLIQWNDSWLNGLLYRKMVEESENTSGNVEMSQCCEYLREVFLSENHYTSLIKRQTEMQEINAAVGMIISGLIDEISEELLEVQKQLSDTKQRIQQNKEKGITPQRKTIEKLRKKEEAFGVLIQVYNALNWLDWHTIEVTLGVTLVSESIKNVMDKHKEQIVSYIVENVKFSLGTGNAYVYDCNGNVESYYKYSNIKDVLTEARLGFPFFYIYIKSKENNVLKSQFLSELRKEIGKELGEAIKISVKEYIDFDATKNAKVHKST